MSEEIAKKKRFEGLGQFQDPLRQSLICLQASMGLRFASENPLLKQLNQADGGDSYLLLSAKDQACNAIDNLQQLNNEHLLCRVHSLQSGQLPQAWNDPYTAKVSAWIEPCDGMAATWLAQLMTMAGSACPQFDLAESFAWGAVRHAKAPKRSQEEFFRDGLKPFAFCTRRLGLFKTFTQRAESLFRHLENVSIVSDGLAVGLLLEGRAGNAWQDLAPIALGQLAQNEHPLVAINFRGQEHLQVMLLTPLRLPLQSMNQSFFKGIIMCRDVRRERGALSVVRAS